jgi:hypothetical protein
MSSASPTPSPSALTPTNKSPQLSSTKYRGSRKGPASTDIDEEQVNRALLSGNNSSNLSYHVTPPDLLQPQSTSTMSAATMSSQFGVGSSSGSNIGSTSPSMRSSSGGGGGAGSIGNGKAGISIVPNASPSSSRSPPYYNGLGGIRTSSGSKGPPLTMGENKDRAGHRKRSSSLVTVEKIETSHEELLDQSAGFNANADWVNYKGE